MTATPGAGLDAPVPKLFCNFRSSRGRSSCLTRARTDSRLLDPSAGPGRLAAAGVAAIPQRPRRGPSQNCFVIFVRRVAVLLAHARCCRRAPTSAYSWPLSQRLSHIPVVGGLPVPLAERDGLHGHSAELREHSPSLQRVEASLPALGRFEPTDAPAVRHVVVVDVALERGRAVLLAHAVAFAAWVTNIPMPAKTKTTIQFGRARAFLMVSPLPSASPSHA